jgi:hypothetical protein
LKAIVIVEFSISPETPKPCKSPASPATLPGESQEKWVSGIGKKHPGIAIRS